MRGVVNAGESVERVKWLWPDDRIRILVAVAAGWLLAIGVRLVFPAVLPSIRAEFGMSISMAGFLLSTLWVGYALMQFPGGVLTDEFGERYALASSSVITIVGIAGVIAAPSTVPLFSASTLIGLGVGIYETTRLTVIGDVFPDRSGTAVGVCQAAGNIGTTLLPPVAGLLAVALGWRWGFIVILPLLRPRRDRPVDLPPQTNVQRERFRPGTLEGVRRVRFAGNLFRSCDSRDDHARVHIPYLPIVHWVLSAVSIDAEGRQFGHRGDVTGRVFRYWNPAPTDRRSVP